MAYQRLLAKKGLSPIVSLDVICTHAECYPSKKRILEGHGIQLVVNRRHIKEGKTYTINIFNDCPIQFPEGWDDDPQAHFSSWIVTHAHNGQGLQNDNLELVLDTGTFTGERHYQIHIIEKGKGNHVLEHAA